MDPGNIPFNSLTPLLWQDRLPRAHLPDIHLCGKINYLVLICPTFAYNKTLDCFAETDLWLFVEWKIG